MSEQLPPEPVAPAPEVAERHPIRIVVNDDLRRSRLTVFFRLILVIPHLVWQCAWVFATTFCVIVNWFAALIKGRSPEDLHLFLARALRYRTHYTSYVLLVSNPYPTFFGRQGAHPVDLEIDGPERQPRLITLFRLILVIPAYVLAYVFVIVMFITAILGWFVALVIGRTPRGMRNLSAYCMRYEAQMLAYLMLLTARYPSLAGDRAP